MKKSFLILVVALLSCISTSAQDNNDDWQPIATWPFVYKEFQQARIITTAGKAVHGMADIHVGMHYLWFINGAGKKLAAKEGTIGRVEFSNGDLYLPVEKKLCKVIREDSIDGKICRVYRSDEVDKIRFNEMSANSKNMMMGMDLGISLNQDFANALNDMHNKVADSEGLHDVDAEPLPMNTYFYMLYDGDTFQVTESNILKHLAKEERNPYRAYTRKAEIIYTNESSVLRIWSAFFVR